MYLRLHPDHMKLDDISDALLLDCASLVKANSIEGCKKSTVNVVYTKWKNLLKTADMVDGQVSFHRPENVRQIKHVEKNAAIVKQLNKTKQERFPDLAQEQQDRLRAVQLQKKQEYKQRKQQQEQAQRQAQEEKQARSYDRIMKPEHMTSTADVEATADSTAAEAYEEDFF